MALAVEKSLETIEHVHEPFLISKGLLSAPPGTHPYTQCFTYPGCSMNHRETWVVE